MATYKIIEDEEDERIEVTDSVEKKTYYSKAELLVQKQKIEDLLAEFDK